MADLTINDEQAALLASANGVVLLRDRKGNVVGRAFAVNPDEIPCAFTPEEIAEAERRAKSEGPWYTTAQVLEHLRSLDTK